MNAKLIIFLTFTFAFILDLNAGSATWRLNPGSSDWNTAANWNPVTVPNGPSDTATLSGSNQPAVALSADTEVSGIVFNAGASAYNITVPSGLTLTLDAGITNSSGLTQSFLMNSGALAFNSASSTNTNFVLAGGGSTLLFHNFSSVGFTSTITVGAGAEPGASLLQFDGNASASDTTIILNGNGTGANCVFAGNSNSFESTITVNGADSAVHNPGVLSFTENSSGGGILIANGGVNGGAGGQIIYRDSAFSSSYVEIYGNSALDISDNVFGATLEGITGDGSIFLGARGLAIVGDSNISFAGTIQDGGASGGTGGSLTHIGSGVLSLTGANTYTGGTTVFTSGQRIGLLKIANTTGSGTGSGPVTISYGTLGGTGTIRGKVKIAGVGPVQPGILAPAAGGRTAATMTIENRLTFKANGIYDCLIQVKRNTARGDRVNARGVTIETGAQFTLLADQLQILLPLGTTFTVLGNTATSPISGTFANLPDGFTITVGSNKFQANYEGGDGNDLTLTVVP